MKKGERIELIKRVARRLGEEDRLEIDLILRQFGLPWEDEGYWDNQYGYALAMLEKAPDESLLELEDYLLSGQGGDTNVDDGAELWHPSKLRAFCSHVSAYKELVSNVKTQLTDYHIDCFVAHEDIEPSKPWQEVIRAGLMSCHVLLAFLTNGFHESPWTDQEVGFCLARGIPVLPIMCGIDPYGFISSVQAIRANDCKPIRIADAVVDVVTTHPATNSFMSEAIVEGFVASSSFSAAKGCVHILGKLSYISEENLQRIENAVQTNEQISHAFGVPAKVDAIVSKHRKLRT